MCDRKKELLNSLAENVVDMEEDLVVEVANEYLKEEFDPLEGIEKGLSVGMQRAGELYEEEEYYIPEILLCSDAMTTGIDILKPHIKKNDEDKRGKVVMGVVQGDTHDIGKNIVKIMLETAGFEVYDLGRDVPMSSFIEEAKRVDADIIAMSTLMTTTMDNMQVLIEDLKAQGIREKFKVMIGGGPISESYAKKIGADGYSASATTAVELAKKLVS
ncbi:corrinoid protein [Asaccharospora irregularis]|uniref:Methylmalonyl-CoA mutase C-terminal domain-containing protein/methyltransferase cognate corrinoid proteins n=1 Tax=Asaccharospora irregularis DSM 2635 TaxID=1121321 RepID=A0A1M5MNV7_9FIRM|nr:corrinoid protein [Asaccharospora irregularis]SHG78453.1 methylmalonyl-CoA mutase C-terminal domain-containing protein/methyltransferase cognate corrinoid proteins [Asaccharospora irregularis DSM 2635]